MNTPDPDDYTPEDVYRVVRGFTYAVLGAALIIVAILEVSCG